MNNTSFRRIFLLIAFVWCASWRVQAATITWANPTSGNWSVAANWNPAQVPGSGDTALITNTMASYTVTLDVTATVGGLVVGGASGAKTVTLNQSGQELLLKGAATVAPSGVLDIGTGGMNISAPLTNNGTVNWQGGGAILMYNDGTAANTGLIWNAGQWNIATSQTLYDEAVTADDFFYNRGTITMNYGGGGIYIEPYLDNTGGTVVATVGTVVFTGGSNLGGSFQAAAGAEVQFNSGTYNWSGTANFSGNVQFTGGTVNVTASVTSLAASFVTITGLSNIVSGAYLTNCTIADAERIKGTVYWTDGTINNGASLTVASTGVLNLGSGNGNYFDISGPLTNNGTVNWSGGGLVVNNDNGVSQSGGIWNLGTWNMKGNLNLSASGGGGYQVFHNAGNLTANANGYAVYFAPFLDNLGGVVVAQGGSFTFAGGSNLGGSFQASSGGAIDFTGGILNWNGTANFSGNVQITGGTVNVTASVTSLAATGVTITGMSNIVSGAYLTNCVITDAEQIIGTVYWAGDSINNGGSLTVAATGTLNLVGGGNGFSISGPLTNNGTVNWSGGSVSINNNNGASYSGVIWNAGSWNIQVSEELGADSGDGYTGYEFFENAGNLVITSPGTVSFQPKLVNTGTVDVETGTLSLVSGATLDGTVEFGLNSLTSYGIISLSGSATLAGTLTAHLNNGYVPIAVGTSFPVVAYGSESGTFTITNLPAVAVWQPIYGATALNLKVVKLVPQMTWAKPANIVYGTALGSGQLDTTFASPVSGGTNITGTFTYTPASGTILDWGSNQTLTVKFTPKDVTDFTNVTGAQTITVTKAPLTVTANNNSKIYGQSFTPADTAYTISGLVNGDTVTSATLASTGGAPTSPVSGSPYAITITNAVGDGGLTNYNIAYVNGSLTVTKAALTVTASPETKTYGQTVLFGSGSTLFTSTGLQNGEAVGSVTLAVSGNGGADTAAVAGSPYTITPSAAAGGTFNAGNYSITYDNGQLTVNKASLTVTATGPAMTYGTALTTGSSTVNFSTAGLVNSEVVSSVTLTPNAAGLSATTAAGAGYTVTPSAATGTGTFATGNYNITYTPYAGTVAQAPLTITASAQSKTFGQTATFGGGSTKFTSSGLKNTDAISTVTITDTDGGGASGAAVGGTYYLTPSAAVFSTGASANYSIAFDTGLLAVTKATPTVTVTVGAYTYTGLPQGPGAVTFSTPADTGAVTWSYAGTGGTTYAASATPPTAAGTYTATATVAADGNNNQASSSATAFTIGKAALTVTATGPAMTYGTALTTGASSANFTTTGLQNGETVTSVTLTPNAAGLAATTAAGAGYTVTPSAAMGANGFATANYAITYTAYAGIVAKAPLTIVAKAQSKTYGVAQTFGSGSAQFTSSGLKNTDAISTVTITDTDDGGAAGAAAGGTYYLTPSAAAFSTGTSANYSITYDTGLLTVNKATPTVTVTVGTYTYDGLAQGPTSYTTSTTDGGGATFSYVGSGTTTYGPSSTPPTLAGTYKATVTVGADGNNNQAVSTATAFSIAQAPLTLTATGPAKTYGTALTTGPSASNFSTAGLQNGETVTSVTLTPNAAGLSATTAAGTAYSVTPSAPTGPGAFLAANYNLTYTAYSGTVGKAPLTVTAKPQSKTYGQVLTLGSGSTLFMATGLQNGENIGSVTLAANGGTAANALVSGSPYTITPSAATGGTFNVNNYSPNYAIGQLTVSPLVATLTGARAYDGTTTAAAAILAIFDVVGGDAGNVTLAGSAGLAGAGAGNQAITSVSGLTLNGSAAGNYTLTGASGSVTINKAMPTVTVTVGSYTYNGQAQGPNAVTTTTPDTGTVTYSYIGTTYPASATPPTAAGSYAVTASVVTDANNLSASSSATAFTIGQAALTVTASAQSKTYGQTLAFSSGSTNFMATGLLNGDTIGTVTLAVSGNGGAGTASVSGSPYTITASAPTGGTFTPGNYAITYASGSLTVNPAPLTITADNTNKYAGETLVFAGTEFAATGLQNSETIGTVSLASPGTAATAAVGPYTITPSAPAGGTFSLANYIPAFVNGTLTVSTPPALTVTAQGSQYVVAFPTLPGQSYQVETSTNLTAGIWSALGMPVAGTGGTASVTNGITGAQAFFQLLITP